MGIQPDIHVPIPVDRSFIKTKGAKGVGMEMSN